jgi:hypothetical protein
MLQAGRSWVRFQVIGFFNWPNPSSRTMVLGSTQLLTEMRTTNLPRSKGRPARREDNLTAICELTVHKMWEPPRLTTLWASTACYRDNFTFNLYLLPSKSFPVYCLRACDWAGSISGNTLDFYFRGAWLQSRTRYRLSWLRFFVVFGSPSRQILG